MKKHYEEGDEKSQLLGENIIVVQFDNQVTLQLVFVLLNSN